MFRTCLSKASFGTRAGLSRLVGATPLPLSKVQGHFTLSQCSFSSLAKCRPSLQSKLTGNLKIQMNPRLFSQAAAGENTWRQKVVGSWMLFSGGLVFGIVVIGGLTRLTESGLSIVEWNPVSGALPPRSLQDWEEEFEKYKRSPEFKINNHDISLENFKKIFWMEWAHRQIGRFIGLEFLFPAIFFVSRGWVSKPMAYRIGGITCLIGVQGLLGWLMVKSGLDDRIVEEKEVPRVSHYRLAAHLGTALAIYSAMIWSAFDLLLKPKPFDLQKISSLKKFKGFAGITVGLIATTALSGALVAGLDAGLIYNEFPYMGDGLVPVDYLSHQPPWKNLFDNPAAVQFNHRCLAITTASAIGGLYWYSKRLNLPKNARLAVIHVAGMAVVQVTLGLTTLLYFVPISSASAHQAGSVTLLTFGLWLLHTLKTLPK